MFTQLSASHLWIIMEFIMEHKFIKELHMKNNCCLWAVGISQYQNVYGVDYDRYMECTWRQNMHVHWEF